MAIEFATSVDYGLTLSKRIYYGKSSATSPPVVAPPLMKRTPENYLPEAVMVYAVVPEPEIVDNPDVPSYQPYVHGKCVPPALIPLHMHGVSMEADCCLDSAYVTIKGTWRVHCVTTSRKCDCRIAIPLGEQGSLLGVEVNIAGRLFHTKLISDEDAQFQDNVAKAKPGGHFLKGQIYTFKIPQVDGGSTLSIKVSWSQKLTYEEDQLCLNIPFTFPGYVVPVAKELSKREKIQLNVNSGLSVVIECKCTSHPLKEVSRGAGKASFLYEAQVPAWSSSNLKFSYAVSSDGLFGGVLSQSPSLHDFDQRQMFCLSLFPGKSQSRRAFRKEVVFLVDISGSMQGDLLENVKNALLESLANLSSEDSFNIIAFNEEIRLFSSSMELASKGAIQNATQWLNDNLIADGSTNILLPLKQALKLLSDISESIPLIFLITDGTVEDERAICNEMKSYLPSTRAISPRICTFGIGLYCNHYFLQMLAEIGRGHYDCAYHPDFVEYRIQRLFSAASSVILADVTLDTSKHVDSIELFPSHIPDLSSGSHLIVSGRYTGTFPDYVKVSGTTVDMTNFSIDLKVQNTKDVQLDRLLARRQIDLLTTYAWLSESKELEDKVANLSIQTGFPSENTHMLILQSGKEPQPVLMQEILNKIDLLKKVDFSSQKIILLGNLGIGFGNMKATAKNTPPGFEESKSFEAADLLVKVASNFCGNLIDHCCCMCFIQTCSSMNKQCSIVLTQVCAALACLECVNCCFELFECF